MADSGFFGYDDSTGKFTFIPDATNTSEVFSGTAGTIVADLEGDVTGAVTGNVTGDLTGNVTGNVTGNSTGTHTGAVNVNNNDVKNADLVEGQLIAGRYGSSSAPMTFTVTVASKTAASVQRRWYGRYILSTVRITSPTVSWCR